MAETSARLLRLLGLLQARRFWSGADLADRLDVTERTVRRDVDRLRSLGYPVQSSTGVAGGYQLGAGASMPPLLLDDDEALAVSLGLRMATLGSVGGIEEAALRALTKLDQVLPQRLRKRVGDLHAAVTPVDWSGPVVPAEVLTVLANASRSHEGVIFRYADGKGQASERRVEPHGLVFTGWRWYLVAWDLVREDWRTFRVDRVEDAASTKRSFVPRRVPGGDIAAYVSQTVASRVYTFRARVIIHAPYERVVHSFSPHVGHLQPIDDERCLLEAGAHSLKLLAVQLGLLEHEFVVEQPPELEAEMKRVAERLAHASRGSRTTRD